MDRGRSCSNGGNSSIPSQWQEGSFSTDASGTSQEGNHELHENVAGEPRCNHDVDLALSHLRKPAIVTRAQSLQKRACTP